MGKQWTIQEVAQAAGTTSRTLRHYDAIGILHPSAIAANGYRLYDASALVRLQRILAMRDLGMSLAHIGTVLDRERSEEEALAALHAQLTQESARLQQQIASVERTLAIIRNGGTLMANDMFDGFQHEQYKDEVEQRWGKDAYAQSDAWWNAMSTDDKREFQHRVAALNHDWQAAAEAGASPESDTAQDLAGQHVEWLRTVPNQVDQAGFWQYVLGLAEMYVNDPRFAANYGGATGATLVRDALEIYVQKHLSRP